MRKVMLAMLLVVLIGALAAPADARGGKKGPDTRTWAVQASGGCTGDEVWQQLYLNPIHGTSTSALQVLMHHDGHYSVTLTRLKHQAAIPAPVPTSTATTPTPSPAPTPTPTPTTTPCMLICL